MPRKKIPVYRITDGNIENIALTDKPCTFFIRNKDKVIKAEPIKFDDKDLEYLIKNTK